MEINAEGLDEANAPAESARNYGEANELLNRQIARRLLFKPEESLGLAAVIGTRLHRARGSGTDSNPISDLSVETVVVLDQPQLEPAE